MLRANRYEIFGEVDLRHGPGPALTDDEMPR
jgi:hypothetical protein